MVSYQNQIFINIIQRITIRGNLDICHCSIAVYLWMTSQKWANSCIFANIWKYCQYFFIFLNYLWWYRVQVCSCTILTYFFVYIIYIHVIVRNDSWAGLCLMFPIQKTVGKHLYMYCAPKHSFITIFMMTFLCYNVSRMIIFSTLTYNTISTVFNLIFKAHYTMNEYRIPNIS